MSHQDEHSSLPRPRRPITTLALALALALTLATACTSPAAPEPPAPTAPQRDQPETPAVIPAIVHANPDSAPGQKPTAFAFSDLSRGFAALGTNLLATQNAGQSWTQRATLDAAITHLDFSTPDTGWAITQAGVLITTKDAGHTWQPSGRRAHLVDFVSATHGFTLEGGVLFTTADGGQTWTQTGASPCDSGRFSTLLSFINPQDGWIACGGQPATALQAKAIYRTHDGGATWELIANASHGDQPTKGQVILGGHLRSLFFLDELHGWIGLTRGVLLTTTDGGVTWQGVKGPMGNAERFITGVTFLTPDQGYVLDQSILYATADGGRTFVPVIPALAPADALPLQMLDDRRWVTAGTRLDSSAILRTDDAGESWRQVGTIPGETVDALYFTPDAKQGWALGTHWAPDASYLQTVYTTQDGGTTWAPRFRRTGVTFASIIEIAPHTLIASTNTGEIHVSRDGGQTFTPLADLPQDLSHSIRMISLEKGWRLRDFLLEATNDGGRTWAPVGLKTRAVSYDLLSDGSAWVVGGQIREGRHQAELFFTPDWGETWSRFDLGPLPGAGAVRCADRDHCLLVGGDNGLYATGDGGRTWEQKP